MAVGNGEMAGPADFTADLVEPLGVKLLTWLVTKIVTEKGIASLMESNILNFYKNY